VSYSDLGTITTDALGKYAATVTPSQTGTVYYRLFNVNAPAETADVIRPLGHWNVTTLQTQIQSSTTPLSNQITSLQNNMNDQISSLRTQNNYLIIGIVIAIIIAIIAIFLGRRT
jgi:hypothetical protein